ncbi:MAG: lipopolysaccharide heptosyltransferase II [Chlamydiae bacterium]|nr:lipopolysaccharide heptosyltransferase II [Chlamydiota bacterium]MBI3277865.1 lipopolysaccharide heptosyltransferase II [Chlamydiota bacterium]
MKILQLVPEMKMGGVETGTLDMARELALRGHEAWVVSGGGSLVQALERAGVKHVELPVHKKSIVSIFRLVKIVRKLIQDQKIDIVHARSRVPAWIGYWAVQGTQSRFVTTAHGYYRPHWGSRVMGWGERVIAVSQAIRDHLIDHFHVAPDRISMIHRGVDLSRFKFCPKKLNIQAPRIGILGRVTPLKGHIDFIQAMGKVVKEFPNAKGLIIGEAPLKRGEYQRQLVKLKNHLGLQSSIEFLPSNPEITEVLQDLDIVVLATTTPEAFGRVVIEAEAIGIPVVATRVGGVVDIIEDGIHGRLVPPRDSDALANGILHFLRDREFTLKGVEAARRRVEEKFTLNLMVNKTLEVYHQLLKSPKILVLKLSALGDLILISPSLKALRKAYPDAQISLLTDQAYAPLFQSCPYLDSIIPFKNKKGDWKNFFRMVHELRFRRFDFSVDLQNNKKSHFLAFLARIQTRIGYGRGGRGILLTKKIPCQKNIRPIESQNRLLHLINVSITDPRLELGSNQEEKDKIREFLDGEGVKPNEKLVGLFPFSNGRWLTKQWGLDRYIELAERLSKEARVIPVFVGGKEDILEGDSLKNLKIRTIDLIGKTNILELSELFKRCSAVVSGDSAPLHVAAASGVSVIGLFGPTDPARHAPPGKVKVMTHSIPCSPCYHPLCKIKTHDCLRLITVDQVLNELKEFLKD